MADDTDFFPTQLMQPLQGIHDGIEVIFAQRTEALVDEKHVGREAVLIEGGESQRQGQGYQKTFATGQGRCRSGTATLVIVTQQDGE